MKILNIVVILCFVLCNSFAQMQRGAGFSDFTNPADLQNYGVRAFSPSTTIKGTSLQFPTSRLGVLKFKNDTKSSEVKLNYDTYNKYVLVETDDKTFAFPVKYVDTIFFMDDVMFMDYYPFEVVHVSTNESHFVEVLVDGPYRLLKYRTSIIKGPTYNEALHTGDRDSKYIGKELYMIESNNEFYKLPKNRKRVLNDKLCDSKIRNFLKGHKYNFANEDELILFINDLNSQANN